MQKCDNSVKNLGSMQYWRKLLQARNLILDGIDMKTIHGRPQGMADIQWLLATGGLGIKEIQWEGTNWCGIKKEFPSVPLLLG